MKNKNCVYRDGDCQAQEKFYAWHYLQWIARTDAGVKKQIIIYNKFCIIYSNNLEYWIFEFLNS